MTCCYLALGSNLDNPLAQVNSAIAALEKHPRLQDIKHSPWYRSAALGQAAQPDYINGVASVQTTLQPLELLDAVQAIEVEHGRVRTERWGPRTLDIDILLYGELELRGPRLEVPHPRMKDRLFVLRPLSDLAPDLTLPCGNTLASLLAHCSGEEVQPVSSAHQED